MADVGRFDLEHSLKQAFDLTGQYAPSLGEGIVPAVQVMDLADSPFALAVPWARRISQPSGVGVFALVAVNFRAPISIPNAVIEITEIWLTTLVAGQIFNIEPDQLSSLPALAGPQSLVPINQRQPYRQTASKSLLGEIEIQGGTAAAALSPRNQRVVLMNANETRVFSGPWFVADGGVLMVAAETANVAITDCGFKGKLHLTTSR